MRTCINESILLLNRNMLYQNTFSSVICAARPDGELHAVQQLSADGALRGCPKCSAQAAQARRASDHEQCRTERIRQGSTPARARRTPASELGVFLLHTHCRHETSAGTQHLHSSQPGPQRDLSSWHAITLRRVCCHHDATESEHECSLFLVLIIGPSSESGCLCT